MNDIIDRPPLEIYVELINELCHPAEAAVWREYASVLDGLGILDELTHSDARAVAASLGVASLSADPAGALLHRADWIEDTPEGKAPLLDPTATAVALRRAAEVLR